MKKCDECKYANWKRTKAGKLHPDKAGKCEFLVKPAAVPSAFYYIIDPILHGGFIYRGEELKRNCPTYDAGK